MTTHYILADDYDRWNPGEPIEEVASDVDYLHIYYRGHVTYLQSNMTFTRWLNEHIAAGNIIRIETDTDTEGRILS